jgi:hypothetical protein
MICSLRCTRRLAPASDALPIHAALHRSRNNRDLTAAFLGIFRDLAELIEAASVSYSGTTATDKMPFVRFDIFQERSRARETMELVRSPRSGVPMRHHLRRTPRVCRDKIDVPAFQIML